jgi:hypothetical protein
MSARAEVPEGCRQIEFPDGSVSRVARDGAGMVEVSDRQAAMIRGTKTDIKIVGVRVGVPTAGPWIDCAKCPRSFIRPTPDSTETLCARCRD